MSAERINEIQQYRANCRAGLDVPDVGYAHEAMDFLLRELLTMQQEIDTMEADVNRLIHIYSLVGI